MNKYDIYDQIEIYFYLLNLYEKDFVLLQIRDDEKQNSSCFRFQLIFVKKKNKNVILYRLCKKLKFSFH